MIKLMDLYFAAHEWSENNGVIVIHFYAESQQDAVETAKQLFRQAYELPDLNFDLLESGILTVEFVYILSKPQAKIF
jgi:hypothetical protein